MEYDVIVIGAGASGMMAAWAATTEGGSTEAVSVLLLERNDRVGKKLLITGKGRCNITNNCDRDKLMGAVRRNPRFLYSAFSTFSPQDVMQFFEKAGVPIKTERGSRVFPESDLAKDVVKAMERKLLEENVVIKQSRVSAIITENGAVKGVKAVDDRCYYAKNVIIATGGLSYPLTGSTGDGYKLAKQVGHEVLPTAASVVPIILAEKWCSDLMGLSLKNVTLAVKHKGKILYSEIGEMMFTHFGISGPLVLSASALIDGNVRSYELLVDLKPGLDFAQLDNRVLRDFSEIKGKAFKNSLNRLLPRSLIPIVVAKSEINPELQVNSITREDRHRLVSLLKAFPLTPVALRPVDEAVVTRGGVSVKNINPKTMASKVLKGLYFAGEVLDLDAVTGGYNLQIAFSTGYLAGISVAEAIKESRKSKVAIAIDGPSAAGKSTIARAIAKKLSFLYIDTGALYRAIGLFVVNNDVTTTSGEEVVPLLEKIKLEISYVKGEQRVILNGNDVSEDIRKPEISMAASNVSAIPEVRTFLLDLQRDIAKKNNVVMDGRDISTVILPDAQVKFFLTADAKTRATRRKLEYQKKGTEVSIEEILADIIQRDYNDTNRKTAPLKPHDESNFIDNTNLTFEETLENMVKVIREKL